MGVYIPKMKMPEYGCACCLFCVEDEKREFEWKCLFLDHDITTSDCLPEDDCPLVELPPHGRLIDADALTQRFFQVPYVCNALSFAPTIIEAEGDE